MKATTTPLKDLMLTGQFVMADLYLIAPVGASPVFYTGADNRCVFGGNTYLPLPIRRGQIRERVGIDVGQLDIEINPTSLDLLFGIPMTQAAHQGFFDGARIGLFKAYAPAWNSTPGGTVMTGAIKRFDGNVSEVQIGRSRISITVMNDLELLNIKFPVHMYHPGCIRTLFDQGCGLSKASFLQTGTVSSGATTTSIPCSLSQATDYFTLGTVKFTAGVNAGISRSVKAYSPGLLTLAAPLPAAPSSGDSIQAYPGCDKQLTTCTNKFSNKANFRGHPFIPVPETAF